MQEALTLAQARAQGQVIDLIPVDRIDGDYLVRDRLVQEEDELQALMTSIQARGQQMPIEIVRLDRDDGEARYGLISGWRRLTALRRLHRDTDDPRFAVVRALVVRPETAQDAYLSMVEENEIRVDVSHYERARIALKSVEQGVFPDQRAALRGLYASTTRSKRSKIGTFVGLVDAFDDILNFPMAISEKLGLAMAREMVRDPGFAPRLRVALARNARPTPAAEVKILIGALTEIASLAPEPARAPDPLPPLSKDRAAGAESVEIPLVEGLTLRFHPSRNRLELTGDRVTDDLAHEIAEFLRSRF